MSGAVIQMCIGCKDADPAKPPAPKAPETNVRQETYPFQGRVAAKKAPEGHLLQNLHFIRLIY